MTAEYFILSAILPDTWETDQHSTRSTSQAVLYSKTKQSNSRLDFFQWVVNLLKRWYLRETEKSSNQIEFPFSF